jgi:hypothetical protein
MSAAKPRLRIGRREFTEKSLLLLLSGVTITISACGSDSPAPTPSPTTTTVPPAQGDVNGVVSANHGHVATVLAAQITAGNAVSLDIRGQATHTHTVNLSAAQIGQVAQRQQVVVQSSTDAGHAHTVTFN